MNKNIFLICLVLLSTTGCTNERTSKHICSLKNVQTMATSPSATGSYAHYVLINDMFRECMDSVTIVRLAIEYADTVKIDRPAVLVKFYNSDKHLIRGEMSQPIELEKDCIAGVMLDTLTKKPVGFYFVDSNDSLLYSGPLWRPLGADDARVKRPSKN